MKITSKVLTTTAQQELSAKQRENARGNIGAQVHLESGDHVRITENTEGPDSTVVSARIDVTGVDYVAGSDYVTVDAETRKVDLSKKTIEKLDSIPAPAKTGTLTIIHGDKTVVFSADDDENREIDTTYGNASDSADGLMSKEDHAKLDGIATGAQVNVQADWEEADQSNDAFVRNKPVFSQVKVTQNGVDVGMFDAVSGTPVTLDLTDTTYSAATAESDGLMSKEDYAKLAGIESGAEANVIESIVLGNTELEPVSKKVTIPNMEGAGEETAGSAGLVPSPSASDREKFLRGDGTWANAPQTDISGLEADISEIQGYIPSDTSTANYLTNKAYVDNQIGTLTARYLASDENGNPFATYAAFSAEGVKFYYAGEEVTAAKNDYAIVSADESAQGKGGVTRYWYTGTDWSFQYIVNTSPFTPKEWAAIQSGITEDLVEKYDGYEDIIPSKISDLKNDSGYITASEVPSREVVHDGTMTGDGTSEVSALSVNTMTGATASSAGAPGLVPAPTAADVNKLLSGSGAWIDPPSSVSTSYDQATHTLTINIG